MVVIDAGPLIALHDRDDGAFRLCVATISKLRPPVTSTWPAVAEAMHVLGHRVGWIAQRHLFEKVANGEIAVDAPPPVAAQRMLELMNTYADTPMDLADASIIELCERTPGSRVFTLDSDFRTYRLHGKRPVPLVS